MLSAMDKLRPARPEVIKSIKALLDKHGAQEAKRPAAEEIVLRLRQSSGKPHA